MFWIICGCRWMCRRRGRRSNLYWNSRWTTRSLLLRRIVCESFVALLFGVGVIVVVFYEGEGFGYNVMKNEEAPIRIHEE